MTKYASRKAEENRRNRKRGAAVTTTGATAGAGLGLAASRRIGASHDGRISRAILNSKKNQDLLDDAHFRLNKMKGTKAPKSLHNYLNNTIKRRTKHAGKYEKFIKNTKIAKNGKIAGAIMAGAAVGGGLAYAAHRKNVKSKKRSFFSYVTIGGSNDKSY